MITVEYIRSTAVGLAQITVVCDPAKRGCGAGRGAFCKSSGGYNVPFHAPRKAAVEHLSEDEKYEAYRQMRAEQELRRRESEAVLRQPLTAEQRRIRAATGEAWRRAGVEAAAEVRAEQQRRKPLGPIRGVAPVADLAAERARRRGVPTSGGAA